MRQDRSARRPRGGLEPPCDPPGPEGGLEPPCDPPAGPRALVALLALAVVAGLVATAAPVAGQTRTATYRNPLDVRGPDGEVVESCADPAVLRGQDGDDRWYLYCTTDPLSSEDRNPDGSLRFRLLPIFSSTDLVHWTYEGEAFAERPEWMGDVGPWAPEPFYADGTWFLYYTAPDTDLPGGGSAIGVATSDSPTGPFVDRGVAVEPTGGGQWVFDAEVVVTPEGDRYLYYGSYFGGVKVRALSADGLSTDPATEVMVAIDNRYEGSQVVQRDGWYYLLVSATDCCRGPLTGYSVFAGRSRSPLGPFVDREGVPLLDGRVGGTPVISMNGNRWVGTGHHDVITDFAGQDWMLYHAVDRTDPYFAGEVGFTKRPVLMDPLDWVDGWPTVRGGLWASDRPMPAPAAQPGQPDRYGPRMREARPAVPGRLLVAEEFDGSALSPAWTWVREPDPATWEVADGALSWDTQAGDLFEDSDSASVLTRPAPRGDYVVEARVRLDVPAEGCCFNYTQAGVLVYGGDDAFVKLTETSIWNTRQTEWAKEVADAPPGYPRYGNSVVGPPGDEVWLRIAVERVPGGEHYTAYTSRDGETWVRGGTWTHDLGPDARIGLVSMGGSGFTATFDHVRVFRLRSGRPQAFGLPG